MLGYPPDQTPPPPGADTPGADIPLGADITTHPYPPTPRQEQTPAPAQCMLGDTVNKRAVCILLECNLVTSIFFCPCLLIHGVAIWCTQCFDMPNLGIVGEIPTTIIAYAEGAQNKYLTNI